MKYSIAILVDIVQVAAVRLEIQHLPESETGSCGTSSGDEIPTVPSEEDLSCS